MAKKYTYVHGLETVLANITRELALVKGRTTSGMMKAMYFLYQETETSNPLTPRSDDDVLPSKEKKVHMNETWFVSPRKTASGSEVVAGYTAPYAEHVHENIGAVNWSRAGSGPKWLQIHFNRNINEMKLIIAKHARIPTVRGGKAASGVSFTNIGSRTTERNVEF